MDTTSQINENKKHLFSTFWVADRLYGIDVTRVQEVTRLMPCTRVPLAPDYVRGLINLRGQIATAIDLRHFFSLSGEASSEQMTVFCEIKGFLLAVVVDRIGDVIEVESRSFEETPETVSGKVRRVMTGVYKIEGELLSVLEVEKICEILQESPKNRQTA